MMTKKISISYIIPVLLSFFIMSFCDLVGLGVDNAKADFELNNTLAQMIPLAVFAWFFFLSVPVGILQDRIGKRNMLNVGMLITALGLFIPYLIYTFPTVLFGFALLGIGNTIIQVSANPLLIDVVPSNRSSSYLSFSQFVKAIGSMVAPFLATYFAVKFGDWKLIMLVFGSVSLLSVVWLSFTKIKEHKSDDKNATFGSCLSLLSTRNIALMVLAIFFVVGIDVGINSTSGQFLMEKIGMDAEPAKYGRSLYFFGKMLGTFAGALLLTVISSRKFLFVSAILTIITTLGIIYAPSSFMALAFMFLIGLSAANIFPLIFSITVQQYPKRSSEISGLMIMAVSGGALIPPVVGKISDMLNVSAGMYVFVFCSVCILLISIYTSKKEVK